MLAPICLSGHFEVTIIRVSLGTTKSCFMKYFLKLTKAIYYKLEPKLERQQLKYFIN